MIRAPLVQKVTWDPLKDFTYLIGLAGLTTGIVVASDAPWKSLPELLVRITALARRAQTTPATTDGLQLDPARHAVTAAGTTVPLTPTEFRLLAKLLASPEHVVRRHALVAAGWPMGAVVHDNTLDSYMARLRRKLDALGGVERSIRTVRGVGYAWR